MFNIIYYIYFFRYLLILSLYFQFPPCISSIFIRTVNIYHTNIQYKQGFTISNVFNGKIMHCFDISIYHFKENVFILKLYSVVVYFYQNNFKDNSICLFIVYSQKILTDALDHRKLETCCLQNRYILQCSIIFKGLIIKVPSLILSYGWCSGDYLCVQRPLGIRTS